MVARTERSPGFGTPLAFPVSQWRAEWRAWPIMARYPLQWRGRAGVAPASELPRSCSFSFSAGVSLSALPPGRKRSLELGSDPGSLAEV